MKKILQLLGLVLASIFGWYVANKLFSHDLSMGLGVLLGIITGIIVMLILNFFEFRTAFYNAMRQQEVEDDDLDLLDQTDEYGADITITAKRLPDEPNLPDWNRPRQLPEYRQIPPKRRRKRRRLPPQTPKKLPPPKE